MFRSYLIITLIGLFLTSCTKPATKVVGSLVKENHVAKKYNRLAVLAFMPTDEGRARLENSIVDNLRLNRVSAVPTYDIFPFATNDEIMDEFTKDMTEEQIEESIQEAINRQNIDALMIVTLLDVKTTSRYIPSTGYSGYYYVPGYDPVYTYSYYGYYSYAYTSYHRPGYYSQNMTIFLESNLYDIQNEGLIWTGQTLTKDPYSLVQETQKVGELIANQLIEKKVVDNTLTLDE